MEKIEKIWLTDDAVWIRTASGKEAYEKFNDYPRLRYATKEQREKYEADEYGLHWEDIDEDLSFEGFFDKQETTLLYKILLSESRKWPIYLAIPIFLLLSLSGTHQQ